MEASARNMIRHIRSSAANSFQTSCAAFTAYDFEIMCKKGGLEEVCVFFEVVVTAGTNLARLLFLKWRNATNSSPHAIDYFGWKMGPVTYFLVASPSYTIQWENKISMTVMLCVAHFGGCLACVSDLRLVFGVKIRLVTYRCVSFK